MSGSVDRSVSDDPPRWAAVAAILLSSACGYAPLRSVGTSHGQYCVRGSSLVVTDLAAVQALEAGARSALSRAGALGPCEGEPRFHVRLTSLRSEPEGIVSADQGAIARGSRISVTAFGWIAPNGGQADVQEIGEAEIHEVVAPAASPSLETQSASDARMRAARSAGEALARMLLGESSPSPRL